ncbi:hypothetical protein ACTJIL_04340 [Luteimonas sp. 22616]|uniref:hypothetical protein n=1 Tax=Luteimonas sp. 22616 TaxID=3453951 RepID=UPI003F8567C6
MTKTHVIALLACLLLAGGCQRQQATDTHASAGDDASQDASPSAISRVVAKAMDRAREQMATRNLTISDDNGGTKAEITPQGDLLVGGDKVEVTDQQRALLVEYRSDVIAIATAGADIGAQGADFGLRTAGKALRGALSGNGDQVEAEIEAEARKFEAHARKICDRLPPLFDTQQQLAAQLSAFKPYATMTQSDIDDCRSKD